MQRSRCSTESGTSSAYSVKLCNLKDFTTPILIERSDRFLWNGLDFYIYNTANMLALGNYDFVKRQILKVNTPPGINCGIASFELYDVLGICDFYDYTGDAGLSAPAMPWPAPSWTGPRNALMPLGRHTRLHGLG